jgi:hypothetical protein
VAKRPVTVNDLLAGQVGLDIECADRVYLNGYVPTLQVPGQIVGFLTRHLGNPIPSPAVMDQIGQRFRRAVDSYAEANQIPVVRFTKGQRKVDLMRPVMARAAAVGRSQAVHRNRAGVRPGHPGRHDPRRVRGALVHLRPGPTTGEHLLLLPVG